MQAGGAGQSIPVCKVNVIRCQKNDSVSKESKDHHPPDNYKSIPGRALARNPSDCRPQHSSDGGWNAGDKQSTAVLEPFCRYCCLLLWMVVVLLPKVIYSCGQCLLAAAAGHGAFLAGVTTRRMRGRRYEIPSTVSPAPLLQQARHPGSALSPPSHRCTAQCQITGGHRDTRPRMEDQDQNQASLVLNYVEKIF